jgi:hypothetical protein
MRTTTSNVKEIRFWFIAGAADKVRFLLIAAMAAY